MIIPSKINKGDEVILVAPSRKVDQDLQFIEDIDEKVRSLCT